MLLCVAAVVEFHHASVFVAKDILVTSYIQKLINRGLEPEEGILSLLYHVE